MKHLERKDYRKVNESFRRRLVYHVGNEYGFFVELIHQNFCRKMISGTAFYAEFQTLIDI